MGGLNPAFVLYYLTKTEKKKKPDGKIKPVTDMRKYKDTIMWSTNEKSFITTNFLFRNRKFHDFV